MRVAIYGSRPDGHANVVLDLFAGAGSEFEPVGLLDDLPQNADRAIGSLTVIGGVAELEAVAQAMGIEGVLLGFGAAEGRAEAAAAVCAAGLALPTLVHPAAQVASGASLGDGVQVLPNASVGPGAELGEGAMLNTGAIAEHDVVLGAGAVVDPGAVLAGRVRVGAGAEIGSGAVVIPDVEIGASAVVGAGAVVVRPVAVGDTVVGVPARPLRR